MNSRNKETGDDTYLPDQTPRREGGDDALAESSPTDSRSDEKVIDNKRELSEKLSNEVDTSATDKATRGR
jgi:hypothetical protein